ncbi:hypothetical protein GCM10010254_19590 [Streptomyces chromofuscus]|nr:hypothetical protein GCM10010254_19590 [Streptomyces chromofuscus]
MKERLTPGVTRRVRGVRAAGSPLTHASASRGRPPSGLEKRGGAGEATVAQVGDTQVRARDAAVALGRANGSPACATVLDKP